MSCDRESESTESSVVLCFVLRGRQFQKWGSGEVEYMQEQHGLSAEEEEEEEEEKEERLLLRLRSQQVVLQDMVIKKGTEGEMEIRSLELRRKRKKHKP